ncbi:hypothetical protein CJY_0037 [Vibrio phage CJY]|uniref:WDGH domain-containing protein n=1 Tax=Vibrio phage J2 TaxID=1558467 RepID=A0A0A7HAP4_9CAUD|nr:hypothetical protein ACQ42_gp37 [Vibrio phage J2]AIZ01436.1 hypothetical protein CJY_0037 [Vibrio phage CJY]AIZ01484.1 hypothetical protein H1_0037 [Vibrio phage H1]AIZ01532.1 hypothetical protein H2_0037 [Vibrio phage H2 SGB-2014]AIZ01676.1 hypothetical protein J3_0037 [Vibrio phage J3]AIZ01628.1 hypothetical protein J2_0037 [Vibrio phage J2]
MSKIKQLIDFFEEITETQEEQDMVDAAKEELALTNSVGHSLERINRAYAERALAISFLASAAIAAGWDVWRKKDERMQMWVLYVETPRGQVSWHFDDRDFHLIELVHVAEDREWNGHYFGRSIPFSRGLMESVVLK